MALRPEPPRRPHVQNSSARLVAPVEPTSASRLTSDSGRRPDVQAKPTPHLASGSSPNANINAKGSGADVRAPDFARAPTSASEDLEASWVLAGPSSFTSWSEDTTGDPEEETVIVDIDEVDDEVAPASKMRGPSDIGRRPSEEGRRGRSTDVVEIVHVHDVRVSSVTALPTYAPPPPPPPAPLPISARVPAVVPGRRDGPVTAADLDALEARLLARMGPALHEALSKERRALKEQRTQLARAAAQLEKQKRLLEAERREIAAERDAAATEKALRRRRSGLSSSGLARLRRA